MIIENIIENIKNAKNCDEQFDSICYLLNFLENNVEDVFFDDNSRINNDYLINIIYTIFSNKVFIEYLEDVLTVEKDRERNEQEDKEIIDKKKFIQMSLNASFFALAFNSSKITNTRHIGFIRKHFLSGIKLLEKTLDYKFSRLFILKVIDNINFDLKYSHKKKYPIRINDELLFKTLTKSRILIGSYVMEIYDLPLIIQRFKKIKNLQEEHKEDFLVTKMINDIFSLVKNLKNKKDSYLISNASNKHFDIAKEEIKIFLDYFEGSETNKLLFLYSTIISGFEYKENPNFIEDLFNKIRVADSEKEKLEGYIYENFSYFKDDLNRSKEWSIKSFINAISFYSIISILKKTNNDKWKIDTFIKFFVELFNNLYENLTYFDQFNLDDWDIIKEDLLIGENDTIEFKSSFGFPVEQEIEDRSAILSIRKSILNKITKTIIAMYNTQGGKIYGGIIENYDKINNEIKDNILVRNGHYFCDIFYTLEKTGDTVDSIQRHIQDELKQLTDRRIDELDTIFSIDKLEVYSEVKDRIINVLVINIVKGSEKIFVKKDNCYMTLPTRATGRTEMVFPEKKDFLD